MARLAGNRVAWTYTDDNGTAWRVAAQLALVSQGKQGGAAAASTVPARPNWGKMRRISVNDGLGHSRTIVLYDETATIRTPGTTINVNSGENSYAMSKSGAMINETTQGGRTTKDVD